MSDTIVAFYGLHWDPNGVAYLMQGRAGSNVVGLSKRPPFVVRLPNKHKHCNHQIPLAVPVPNDHHWDFFNELVSDPLVRAMLPIPKETGGTFFVEEKGEGLENILALLTKMSNPIYNVVMPVWTLTKEAIIVALQETNVQPFVLTMVEAKHSEIISQVAKAAVYLPRTLIIAGKGDVVLPASVKRITTSLDIGKFDFSDLIALPWESLGAVVLRKFMRREWNPRGSYEKTESAKRESA